jgi:hypothetical protein
MTVGAGRAAAIHLAGGLRTDTIIADPTGELRRLRAALSRRFAEEVWVGRRCEAARRTVEDGLRSIDPSTPWHDQVTTPRRHGPSPSMPAAS